MTSNPVDSVGDVEQAYTGSGIAEPEPEHRQSLIVTNFFSKLSDKLLPWAVAIGCVMETLSRLWTDNYWPLLFREEDEILPRSTLAFITKALIAFAAIKSQPQTEYPFKTHPRAIMVSVTSVLIYGFASAAEHLLSAQRVDPPTVSLIIARLGRIASLCILVASLAFLLYF